MYNREPVKQAQTDENAAAANQGTSATGTLEATVHVNT
jgi:hypothetical protein